MRIDPSLFVQIDGMQQVWKEVGLSRTNTRNREDDNLGPSLEKSPREESPRKEISWTERPL